MAVADTTADHPFFQPRPETANLQTAYLLWKLAGNVAVTSTGCWEWQGVRLRKGYGRIGVSKKDELVHRLVYKLCVADVPVSVEVCHHCDNPPCCNPAHLFAGTRSANLLDMVAKRRHKNPCPRGQKKPAPKLSDDAVRTIRRRADAGGKGTVSRLALEFDVSVTLISNIIHRHRYASVSDEVTLD